MEVKKMIKILTLNDVFPNAWNGSGVFSHMKNPVWGTDYDPQQLDILFMSKYSEKIIGIIAIAYSLNMKVIVIIKILIDFLINSSLFSFILESRLKQSFIQSIAININIKSTIL